ncbi:MAG: hypothetical protein QME51_09930 [Planctomycetota bacterium]|nr:hypothetical protein [Planctomycetota bacterium]MDI6788678.1 hypothetical protein [Planctomycetota bacterium]
MYNNNRVINKTEYVHNKALLVGVDISKEHLDAYGRGNGQEMKTFARGTHSTLGNRRCG